MKPIHYLIAISLLANVALFAWIKNQSAIQLSQPSASLKTTPPTASEQPKLWTELKSAAPGQLIKKLQAIGIPSDAIKALVTARIREIYRAKQNEIWGNSDNRPYWQQTSRTLFVDADADKFGKLVELQREEVGLVEKLFGDDAYAQPIQYLRQRYGDLPIEKLNALAALNDQYDAERSALSERRGRERARSITDSTLAADWRAMDVQQATNVAKLLTPDELLEYNLRNSTRAMSMRMEAASFKPTEQEFRTL